MADITEGSVFSLGIAQVIRLEGYGVATAVVVGTAKLNAKAVASGVSSAGAVGTAKTDADVNPVAINAASGSAGTPQFNAFMHATGIAGAEQFGDADTIATAFIIPGPVDPSNDFGNPVATKYGWIFRTPRNTYQWRVPPYKEYEGISLLKESGTWVEVAHPDLERTLTATKYLAGGRDHVVSDSLKADLVAAGYSVTTEIVTTEDYKS